MNEEFYSILVRNPKILKENAAIVYYGEYVKIIMACWFLIQSYLDESFAIYARMSRFCPWHGNFEKDEPVSVFCGKEEEAVQDASQGRSNILWRAFSARKHFV